MLNALRASFGALSLHGEQFFATLASLVATILQEEGPPSATPLPLNLAPLGLLKKLMEVQRLDRCDIEGVYPVFCSLLDTLPLTQRDAPSQQTQLGQTRNTEDMTNRLKETTLREYENAQHALLRRPVEEKLELLRDWLISTTAKDCSIFITLQLVKKSSSLSAARQSMPEKVFPKLLPSGREEFDFLYKVQIADLDLKPVTKIPYQFHLDGEILSAVQQQHPQQHPHCAADGEIRTEIYCRHVKH